MNSITACILTSSSSMSVLLSCSRGTWTFANISKCALCTDYSLSRTQRVRLLVWRSVLRGLLKDKDTRQYISPCSEIDPEVKTGSPDLEPAIRSAVQCNIQSLLDLDLLHHQSPACTYVGTNCNKLNKKIKNFELIGFDYYWYYLKSVDARWMWIIKQYSLIATNVEILRKMFRLLATSTIQKIDRVVVSVH